MVGIENEVKEWIIQIKQGYFTKKVEGFTSHKRHEIYFKVFEKKYWSGVVGHSFIRLGVKINQSYD
jgi:hypothetical protein